jgi:hypothetical protein
MVGETGGAVGGDVEEAAGTLVAAILRALAGRRLDGSSRFPVLSRYIAILKEAGFYVVPS